MKTFGKVMLVLLVLVALIGTIFITLPDVEERQSQVEQKIIEEHERKQGWVVEHLLYIKDENTGICFAYYNSGTGGPALATVLCNLVEAHIPPSAQ